MHRELGKTEHRGSNAYKTKACPHHESATAFDKKSPYVENDSKYAKNGPGRKTIQLYTL